eukprot:SAG11_NODE_1504_length_4782_cov_3.311125_4_plen_273_part_00
MPEWGMMGAVGQGCARFRAAPVSELRRAAPQASPRSCWRQGCATWCARRTLGSARSRALFRPALQTKRLGGDPLRSTYCGAQVRISDARMSGTSYGTCVLHVAPEAAVGGPLALVKDGDMIGPHALPFALCYRLERAFTRHAHAAKGGGRAAVCAWRFGLSSFYETCALPCALPRRTAVSTCRCAVCVLAAAELDTAGRGLNLLISDEEMAVRKSAWRPRPAHYGRGFGKMYSMHVTQADQVTRPRTNFVPAIPCHCRSCASSQYILLTRAP